MIDHNSLRHYRLQKGLSQKEVAETLHIATNTLSDYENGKVLPNMMMFQEILRTLGYSISLSVNSPNLFKRKESLYYTRKESRENHVKSDMEIHYRPYLDFIESIQNDIERGILSSVWEFVDFVYKGVDEVFLQNGIHSKEGKAYIRVYKTRGTFAVKKAVFENHKLTEVLDEWATLEEINDNMYSYIKYKEQTEVLLTHLADEGLNEKGKELFTEDFYQKYVYGIGGEI